MKMNARQRRTAIRITHADVNTWLAAGAMIISLCALLLTVFEAVTARKQARLSVVPQVDIDMWHDTSSAGVRAVNNALGPAVVQYFEVTVDGKAMKNWSEVLDSLHVNGNFLFHYAHPGKGTIIKAGDMGYWLRVDGVAESRILWNNSARLNVVLCYCSLYHECWLATLYKGADLNRPTGCKEKTQVFGE